MPVCALRCCAPPVVGVSVTDDKLLFRYGDGLLSFFLPGVLAR